MEIGTARRPCGGEIACGDAFVVLSEDTTTTIGLADGLGHGKDAARAAEAFCEFVRTSSDAPLEQILLRSAEVLSRTRGVVAALMRVDRTNHRLSVAGIGNVTLRAVSRVKIDPVWRSGLLGPGAAKVKARCFDYDLTPADFVVMHSDGIRYFDMSPYRKLSAQSAAEEIIRLHSVIYDDASCVVLRY